MSTKRVFNFNPGPAMLPLEVLDEVKNGFMNFGGMSILEISHRSKDATKLFDDTKALLKDMMEIPAGYQVLFLQGGASLQFAMVPLNLLDKEADYSVTGEWAKKALKEAKPVGKTNVVFSSENLKFSRVPKAAELKVTGNSSYLHITSNNTIYGTEYHEFPNTENVPLVADMSSDILSSKIDVSKFGLIYAGAQKNLGPAGVTLVIIKDDLLKRNYREIPTYLKYSVHAEANSCYNTPPVFAIYVMKLVLSWLAKEGGVSVIEKRNKEKAALIYDVLDNSDLYLSVAEKDSRSMMNVTFNLPSEELENKFVTEAKEKGFVGLKGHRSVGGIRASIYNAFPFEGVEKLVRFMKEFKGTSIINSRSW